MTVNHKVASSSLAPGAGQRYLCRRGTGRAHHLAHQSPITLTAVLIRVAATTGARRGELAGLQWGDIDLDTGQWRVAHSATRGLDDATLVRKDTKTHQERTVHVDPATVTGLRARRKRCVESALAVGARIGPASFAEVGEVHGLVEFRGAEGFVIVWSAM